MNNAVITFIGAGNMASCLIGGLVTDGYPADLIYVTNPEEQSLKFLREKFNIRTTKSNVEGASHADVLLFAVKPQIIKSVVEELATVIRERKPLIISIAAGIRELSIRHWLSFEHPSIVRCMPNTPALVKCGITALFANAFVSDQQKALAESILRAVGLTIWVKDEMEMDIVTALSGSGPAYFFLIMECLQQAAIDLGLSEEKAGLLTVQTALGAAKIALESNKSMIELRQQVTSPGGTTECALEILEKGNIRDLFTKAINAAKQRSVELSQLFDKG